MKSYFKLIQRIIPLILFSIILLSCDLEVQDEFELDTSLDKLVTFEDQTVWEWLQTRTSEDPNSPENEEFDLMVTAIQVAGMVDEYNQETTTDRTYLLLNNNAFLGGGDIIQVVTGSSSGDLETEADVDVLRKVLNYHIVTTYITQNNPILQADVDYKFQTLNEGEEGEIYFRRDTRLFVTVNHANAPLPSTATNEGIRAHNYIFKNGIGHVIQDHVRNVPFN